VSAPRAKAWPPQNYFPGAGAAGNFFIRLTFTNVSINVTFFNVFNVYSYVDFKRFLHQYSWLRLVAILGTNTCWDGISQ